MNYFETKNVAERYENGRPYFHHNTIAKIKNHLGLTKKLEIGLDIACGTGLSSKALLEIAEHVYGTDISEEMLNHSYKNDKIFYKIASAENQPFESNCFDIVTVSSGVHWFDIDKFLIETNRILKPKSWLVLYENYFISEMQSVKEFSLWFPEVYCKKYPSPPRQNNYAWTNENLENKNFRFDFEDNFQNEIEFTKDELILYFTTQSNITSQVENNITTYQEVESWLDKELEQFFKNEPRKINYGNWIKYLQKTD
jgi:ubiquinone/menaquinone biosynthesis C-methylase UbiE